MLNKRLLCELALLDKLQKKDERLTSYEVIKSNPLTIIIDLLVKGNNYSFKAVFPRFFPYQPIIIYKLTDFNTQHCYADGAMCLEHGVDNWDEGITLTSLIDNLCRLLEDENPLGDIHGKSSNGDTFSLEQLSRYVVKNNDLIISETIFQLAKNKREGTISFLKKIKDNKTIYISYSVIENNDDLDASLYESIDYKYVDVPRDSLFNKETIISHIDFNKNKLIYVTNDNRATLLVLKPEIEIVDMYSASYEIEKRIQIDREVTDKRITILGLGSVGSRVLVDLARAGFSNFYIVDNDLLLPHNIVRHELTKKSIGCLKVEELKKIILNEINPNAIITWSNINVLGQTSTTCVNTFISKCCESDIIIDCSANDNLLLLLDKPTTVKKIPVISGTVIPGGLGNIILYKNVNDSISMESILSSFYCWKCKNNIFGTNNSDYSSSIDNQPYVATMSDCSILSGILGKIAINVLKNSGFNLIDHISVFSTSNYGSLQSFYHTHSINANNIKKEPVNYIRDNIDIGKRIYEDYLNKRSVKKNKRKTT